MATRLVRLILGVLILISQFLEPSARWLSWGVVALLFFEGITNIRILEPLLISLGTDQPSSQDAGPAD